MSSSYNTANRFENILLQGMVEGIDGLFQPSAASRSRDLVMCIDLVCTNDKITIYAEIPSVKKEDINMEFYNNIFTLTVEKRKPAGYVAQQPERMFGKVTKTIKLPIAITRREGIVTKYEDGLLTVEINRRLEEENKFSISV